MKTEDEKKVTPSFDDLVFENRNKEYGAYKMRKNYNSALLWSLLISVFFIGATVFTPFIVYEPVHITKPVVNDTLDVEFTDLTQIQNQKIEEPKQIIEKTPQLDYSKPEVVEKITPEEENKFLTSDELNSLVKNDSISDYKPDVRVEIAPELNDKINESFSVTEKPYFGIDGDNEFRGWIAKHIIYPQSAIDANLQGRVYLQFVIEKDGSISNIQIVKSIDPEFSKEAVRVLELSPKWNPGKINGMPVRVKINFPITFAIK